MEKVILISVDGMRPDGTLGCGNDFVKKLMHLGGYSLTTQTVMKLSLTVLPPFVLQQMILPPQVQAGHRTPI